MFHVKRFTSKNQKLGLLGEGIATNFLKNKGFSIIDRNYTKKFGEIDIISKKDGIIFFSEVKSVSQNLSTDVFDGYRPEDMVHYKKRQKLKLTIKNYLAKAGDIDWQFNVICILIDQNTRRARVKVIEDIVL